MNSLKYLDNDLLLDIGRIAALRGDLRLSLLSAGDALLTTRLGDQGIARLMMAGRDLPEICQTIKTLAQVRGASSEAVKQLAQIAEEFRDDFESATAIANGSWTYLGGDVEKYYGLFLGEAFRNGDLEPQWRQVTVEDLRRLVVRLEKVSEALRPFYWVMRAATSKSNDQEA